MRIEFYLIHREGIERGPYSSQAAAIKSCPMATGYRYSEAIQNGWKIKLRKVKENMNKAKELINLVEAELDREAELKNKPISELTDDELIYMVMFTDVIKASTEHPYMIEAAKRGLMVEDEKGYAQLTKEGWETWNQVKGSYGLSAGVSQ
jgi:hypothetical protein